MNDSKGKWITERTEKGPNIKLFDVQYQFVRHEETGHRTKIIILDSVDSCNVIAITPDKTVVMTRQFRFGIGDYTLEIPGGFVEKDEDPSDAVKRELEEETGYVSGNWKYLGKIPSNPVFQNSYIHHFVAYDAQPVGNLNWDDSEEIEVELVPLGQVKNDLLAGRFQHPHTISAFSLIEL